MNPILELRNVSKSFGKQKVLHPLSFDLKKGERICILGPSGCGKSTLLQIVAGLARADGGEVHMEGRVVEKDRTYVPPEKRPVNMVFQDYALWPHMSVRQNIEYGMRRRKTPPEAMRDRLARLQALLRLDGLLDRLPAELSGGQQQRVGIARALATEPAILLMDEPLSNLDVKLRTDMRNELARLLGELSIAALYVTHDMMEAFTIADRILVLRGGHIDQIAEPHVLFERPETPWVAQLMGYHNRLDAMFVGDGTANVRIANATIGGRAAASGRKEGKAVVMIHPEYIDVREESGKRDGNALPATIAQSVYEGTRWRLIAETGDGQKVHIVHDRRVEPGKAVQLLLPRERTMMYADLPAASDE
ncbi:ABC transporter ATP-binding protein [Paenibacillus hodogayensis]|uniref:ABC transporter ATP-binding protein n=1 Tax=Paenibacillus hodogayensis TaxID=279208 RepID=A0ABV5VTZ2_9BACL